MGVSICLNHQPTFQSSLFQQTGLVSGAACSVRSPTAGAFSCAKDGSDHWNAQRDRRLKTQNPFVLDIARQAWIAVLDIARKPRVSVLDITRKSRISVLVIARKARVSVLHVSRKARVSVLQVSRQSWVPVLSCSCGRCHEVHRQEGGRTGKAASDPCSCRASANFH